MSEPVPSISKANRVAGAVPDCEVIRIPKWFFTIFGSCAAIIFAGLLTWLTSMNVAIQANTVDIASIRAELKNQIKSTDEVKEQLSRIDDKLDALLERLSR